MTELEKKVFREVFVGKYVKIPTEEERNKIINFYSDFDVYISITAKRQVVDKMAYIQIEDGLTAYGLFGMLSTTYSFDDLKEEYAKELRRKRMKEEAREHYWQPYTFEEIMRGFEATMPYHRRISGIRTDVEKKAWSDVKTIYFDEYKPLPNKIAFRNDTTTLVYDDFKVVRAKASNKDEAIRETGLLVALLKALNVKDYNTIIANAWDTENELTRHFYLYGVVQQLYVDKKLLSRNQFNKLFEAVGDKKPNVNIGGKIIELEYK